MNKVTVIVIAVVVFGFLGIYFLTSEKIPSDNQAEKIRQALIGTETQESAQVPSSAGGINNPLKKGDDNSLNPANKSEGIGQINSGQQGQVQGQKAQQAQQTQQQTQQPVQNNLPPGAPPLPGTINVSKVVVNTSKGDLVIELYSEDAPNTVQNFLTKARDGFYNNLTFHRVEDWVVQGGDPKGNGTGGNNTLATEFSDRPFVTGSVGVARGNDRNVSNDSQWFITKSDASWLNGEYTNFGTVLEGMEVVNKLQRGDKILSIGPAADQ